MSDFPKKKKSDHAGERIAKVMARVGLCSRRDAEAWIENGRVSVNGKVLTTAAVNVDTKDIVLVDGKPLPEKQLSRVWLYYKPKGLMTTAYDPEGRATVFDNLPADMPRVISIGRLDLNSEGLLLLTNDGELARRLELPSTAWVRHYRVRVNGRFDPQLLDGLKNGIEVDGVRYGPIIASFDRQQGANAWLNMALTEGKNREIRRICQHFGWPVSRLIRVGYGPFRLGEMEPGQVAEVKGKQLKEQLQFGNEYRHDVKADPEKVAQESDNRRARRERPEFGKGPDKRTREKNMPREEREARADRGARSEREARHAQADRPAGDEAPRRNQRPGRNERLARADGAPPRFEKPARDKSSRGEKPNWGNRPDRGDRPGTRPEPFQRPARPSREDRETREDRAPRTERPTRDSKPSWADKPRRDARPERNSRPERDSRPERQERSERPRGDKPSWSRQPERDEQPVRQERARRNDRGARNEAARSERPERREQTAKTGLKPGWAKNKPGKPQPGTSRKPPRERPSEDARYERPARADAPRKDTRGSEKPRSGGKPPSGGKPRGDKPAWGDKPRSDGPRGGKPFSGKSGGGKPSGSRPSGDRPKGKGGSGKPGSGNARRFR